MMGRRFWVLATAAAVLAGAAVVGVVVQWDRSGEDGPVPASGAIPFSEPDVINPMRGQFDNILTGLFPQSNPSQAALPDWPGTRDAAVRVSWRSLQPTDPSTLDADAPDDQRYDFSQLDRALDYYGDLGRRVSIRITSYDSCCEQLEPGETNLGVPDWFAAMPGTIDTYERDGVIQVLPDWNSDAYLDQFGALLAALGRRYDRDERLSVFEMSGYGDFSENVLPVLRDFLDAPGPPPEDSERVLGYYSQYEDQVITAASVERLVTANLRAFPRTQMVTAPGNAEIIKQLMRDNDALADVEHPVGVRADCLGVDEVLPTWATNQYSEYVKRSDPIIEVLTDRLRNAPVMTEWCQLPDGTSPRAYYERGLDIVVDQRVSMTSSSGFPDQFAETTMDPERYDLWYRANVYAGYRYVAAADLVAEPGRVTGSVRWTNYGTNSTHERWTIQYGLTDESGEVNATADSGVDLRTIDTAQDPDDDAPTPATARDRIEFDGVAPGRYIVTATVSWAEHKPDATTVVDFDPMNLAMRGRAAGAYPIGTVTVAAAP